MSASSVAGGLAAGAISPSRDAAATSERAVCRTAPASERLSRLRTGVEAASRSAASLGGPRADDDPAQPLRSGAGARERVGGASAPGPRQQRPQCEKDFPTTQCRAKKNVNKKLSDRLDTGANQQQGEKEFRGVPRTTRHQGTGGGEREEYRMIKRLFTAWRKPGKTTPRRTKHQW